MTKENPNSTHKMSEDVSDIRFSVFGGIVTSIWIHINSEDLIKTAVMASIGTIVSYAVSLLVKFVHRWIKHRKK